MNLAEKIKKIESKIAELKFELRVQETVLGHLRSVNNTDTSFDNPIIKKTRIGSVAAHVEAILRESNGPMPMDDIEKKVVERGVASNPKLRSLISSVISKDKDTFIRIAYGIYDLKERTKE